MLKRIAVLTLACLAMGSLASAQLTSNARNTFETKMFSADGYFQIPKYAAAPVACNADHRAITYINSSTGVVNACNGSSWLTVPTSPFGFTIAGPTSAHTYTVADSSVTLADTSTSQSFGAKTLDNTNTVTLKDNLFTLQDGGDVTRQAQFQLSGITAGQTRTYTMPDASDTVAVLGTAQTFSATKTFSATPVMSGASVGTAAASTVVEGLDGMHRTTFTFAVTGADKVTLADGAHGGGRLVYTFPEGEIYILGAVLDGVVTNTAAFNASVADLFVFGIGTAAAGDDDALTGTEQDIIPSTSIDTDSGGTLTRAEKIIFSTPAFFDGTTAAKTLYVNFAVPAANNSGSNDFGLTGTMTIVWSSLGDK